jgi:hypothetical protein
LSRWRSTDSFAVAGELYDGFFVATPSIRADTTLLEACAADSRGRSWISGAGNYAEESKFNEEPWDDLTRLIQSQFLIRLPFSAGPDFPLHASLWQTLGVVTNFFVSPIDPRRNMTVRPWIVSGN